MSNIDPEESKRIMKEALREWMDEKFTHFGKWSAAALGTLALGALVYFVLKMNGWAPK